MVAEKDTQKSFGGWKVEKTISLGDLATILLIFVSAAAYVSKNESDKTQMTERQQSAQKEFVTFVATQTNVDKKQDDVRDDAKKDTLAAIAGVNGKLDTITLFLMRGSK